MAANLPNSLKAIQPYLKVAKEYEKRDPVVSYYCRLHAVQKGIKIDSKSPDGKGFLFGLMDQLEMTKKELAANDAITNDVVGQAHVDEQASQLFLWADTEDRAARFNKNVIKSFYTASLIYDTLVQFGELTDEASQRQKYSKWKATYINKCLKEGVTPVPGPPGGEEDEFGDLGITPYPTPGGAAGGYPPDPSIGGQPSPYMQPPSQPAQPPPSYSQPSAYEPEPAPSSSGGASSNLTSADFDEAQKYCRYAISAMQYEDVPTATDNLQKALKLLQSK